MFKEKVKQFNFTEKGINKVKRSDVILTCIIVPILIAIAIAVSMTVLSDEGIIGRILPPLLFGSMAASVIFFTLKTIKQANKVKPLIGKPYMAFTSEYLEGYDDKANKFKVNFSQINYIQADRVPHTLFQFIIPRRQRWIALMIPFGRKSIITIHLDMNQLPEFEDPEVAQKLEDAKNKKGMLAGYARAMQSAGLAAGYPIQLLPCEYTTDIKYKQLEEEIEKVL